MLLSNDLAVILLNWEHASQTLKAIQMVSSWKKINPFIIIVDNGSSDSDKIILQKGVKDHCLIFNSHNRGFAGGNNDGISVALEKGNLKILLLNADASVTEECIQRLLYYLEMNPEIGAIGPLLEVEGKTFAGGRDIGVFSDTQILINGRKILNDTVPVDYVSGTVFLARAEVFQKCGLLTEDYFFSGEIADFCCRIRKRGFVCKIYTKCKAVHKTQITFLRRTLYPYYSMRNRFLYVQRNKKGCTTGVLIGKWVITGMIFSIIAYIRGNKALSRSMRMAVKDGFSGRFGNQNQRILGKTLPESTKEN